MQTEAATLRLAVLPRAGVVTDAILVVAGAGLIAGSAQISISLPFTPVPITGQTFSVLLVGASLGAARGGASVHKRRSGGRSARATAGPLEDLEHGVRDALAEQLGIGERHDRILAPMEYQGWRGDRRQLIPDVVVVRGGELSLEGSGCHRVASALPNLLLDEVGMLRLIAA